MKQISEEDRRILKGNIAMRDNPNSSITQIAIANTVIMNMVKKYCSEEIEKAWQEILNFDKFAEIKNINLGDKNEFKIN